MPKYFIKNATKHKGALHRSLGIPRTKNIPTTLLDKIKMAKVGGYMYNPYSVGKRNIRITKVLKKRTNLALTLRKFKK